VALQVHQELQVAQAHLVPQVHLDHQELQVHQVAQVHPVHLVHQELQVHQVHQVHQALQVQLVQVEPQLFKMMLMIEY